MSKFCNVARGAALGLFTVGLSVAVAGAGVGSVPVAIAAPVVAPGAATESSGGSLVIVGGALASDNAAVYGDIVRLAGGAGVARIGVITAAAPVPSEDPDAGDPDLCNNSVCNGIYYSGLFKQYGAADAQWIPVDLDRVSAADDDAVVAQVNSMTGFFFGGGDQQRYLDTLMHGAAHTDSKVLAAIRAKLAAGAVVSGVSAGDEIQQGADMVTGGASWEAWTQPFATTYQEDAHAPAYEPKGGFGFFTDGLLDSHCSERGRQGRSVRLAELTGHRLVYCVDENTALEVTHVGTSDEAMRILGTGGVSVLDTGDAVASPTATSGVRWTYLTDGDRYAPSTGRIRFSAAKSPVVATGKGPRPSHDVFSSWRTEKAHEDELLLQSIGLVTSQVSSTGGTTFEGSPRLLATLTRGAGERAYSDGAHTSFTGVLLAIAPVR